MVYIRHVVQRGSITPGTVTTSVVSGGTPSDNIIGLSWFGLNLCNNVKF